MPSVVLESMFGVFGLVGVPRLAPLVVVVALRRSGPAASASHGLPVFSPPFNVSFLELLEREGCMAYGHCNEGVELSVVWMWPQVL